jgi:O-antigen/teichoic acid export membrane protein
MSSLPRRIAYNVVISSAAKIAGTVLALVGIGFITRYLGKEGFGDYSTVLAFFTFFSALADLGLYAISTREISRPGSDELEILGNVFSMRLFLSVAVVLITPLLVFAFPYSSAVKFGIMIAAFAYVFSSSYAVLIGLFQKRLAMDKVAIGELIGRIFQVIIIVLVVQKNIGFLAIIGTLFINMLVSFLVIFGWSRKYLSFSLRFDWKIWKKFLAQSYPVGISAIITFAYFKLDTIFLSVMKTNAEVGIYNAAYKVLENISFFPAMLVGLVMPIMSLYIFHDRNKFLQVADKTFKVFLILTVPLVIGILFLAKNIINLIGGAGFSEAVLVLKILSFAVAFIFFGNFFTNVLIAGNLQKKMMKVLFFCAVFNVSLNLLLIPKFSYLGAALTSSLTEFLVAALTAFLCWKNLEYLPSLKKSPAILASGLAMAIFLYIFSSLNFFILAIFSGVAYFALLWVFRVVTTRELRSLISRRGEEIPEYEPVI